jgi:hypothetical protein
MITLRLYSYSPEGDEVKTDWSFEPLHDLDGLDYDRESDQSTSGTKRRRPFARREVREITLGAGTLLIPKHQRGLQAMLDAHKIEWQRQVNGKTTWVEFVADLEGSIRYERVDEIDPLKRFTFTLEQAKSIPFTKFNDPKVQFTDGPTWD